MIDTYYERGYHGTHQRLLIGEPEYYQARAELALNYWLPDERRLKILDYGCGLGQSIALLPNAEGWDVSSEAREICRANNLTVYDDKDEIPRGAYDRVFCRHVLEHLEHPLDDLCIMRELLTRDGQLVIVLPVEEHFMPKDDFRPDINQHLYCWTPRTIGNLLWRANMQPLSVTYEYPFGWHGLLPIRRFFGVSAYHAAVRIGSRIFKRNGEMIIRAKRESEGRKLKGHQAIPHVGT